VNLGKKHLISFSKTEGRFSMMYWMFLRMTYWTYSGVKETTETMDGASFFTRFLISSYPDR
jgi:hypothetical protein